MKETYEVVIILGNISCGPSGTEKMQIEDYIR